MFYQKDVCQRLFVLHAQKQHRFLYMKAVLRFIINFAHMLFEYIFSDLLVHMSGQAMLEHYVRPGIRH